MYISNAKIENFRALETISVPLNQFSVLIGENDVGKTSFLYAINYFYEEPKINNEDDFFKKEIDRIINVTLTFANLPEDDELDPFKSDDGTLTIKKTFKYTEKLSCTAITNQGLEKKIPKELVKKWFSTDNFHFIPVRRDLAVQFSMNKTALLGKTLRAKMKKAIDDGGGDKSLDELKKILSKSIDEPKNILEQHLQEQMHNKDIMIGFENLIIDPVEGVTFNVKLSDDRIKDILIQNRGAGTQNNLIIALFRLIAGYNLGNYLIFAMEEPENSLHPKAQRQLLSVLQELSQKSQIIITTHSPIFIERTKFENNIIISRTMNGNSIAKTFNESMLTQLRTDLGIRPSDTLLKGGGNCAIIVEGKTEEEGFPVFMEMMDLSEFKLGIAIINAEGSDRVKINNICKLLKAYEIPCVVVLDNDAQQTAEDLVRESKNSLDNLKKVYCLSKGTIEDYYPLEIVAETINENLNPSKRLTKDDFDNSLHGRSKLDNFKRIMFENECGEPLEFLKRILGQFGTKKMRDRNMELDDELKQIFLFVKEIVSQQ